MRLGHLLLGTIACGFVLFNQNPRSVPTPDPILIKFNNPAETNLAVGAVYAPPNIYPIIPTSRSHFIRPVPGKLNFGFGNPPGYPFPHLLPHLGHDYDGKIGDPVKAAADGKVVYAGWDNHLGNCIVIEHSEGYSTTYGHLERIDTNPGQTVKQGDIIGAIGNTGNSSGPHLHFEVRKNGQPKDPIHYHL